MCFKNYIRHQKDQLLNMPILFASSKKAGKVQCHVTKLVPSLRDKQYVSLSLNISGSTIFFVLTIPSRQFNFSNQAVSNWIFSTYPQMSTPEVIHSNFTNHMFNIKVIYLLIIDCNVLIRFTCFNCLYLIFNNETLRSGRGIW